MSKYPLLMLLESLKALLEAGHTDKALELIEKLIAQAQAAAEDFCRVSFEEDVPEPVRLACLLFVSYHYENRDIPDMTTYKSMRMAFEHLLYPHRDPTQMF